jgi:hypothetical protein
LTTQVAEFARYVGQNDLMAFCRERYRGVLVPKQIAAGRAFAFMVPFIADKKRWPHKPDMMYFDEWPARQPALWFSGHALSEPSYIELWKTLNPDPTVEEVIRNSFIRQPLRWH